MTIHDDCLNSCPKNCKWIVYTIVLGIVHNIVHDIVHESCPDLKLMKLNLPLLKGQQLIKNTPSPRITRFPLAWFPLTRILAYVRASGEFCVSWIISTVPLTQFLRNTFFSKPKWVQCREFSVLGVKIKNFLLDVQIYT